MICIKRTQDVDEENDSFCVACWNSGDYSFQPANYYTSREDCMEEFLVTEEEFDRICKKVFDPPRTGLFPHGKTYWPSQ